MANEQPTDETEQLMAWVKQRIHAYDRTVLQFMIHHFPDRLKLDLSTFQFPLSPSEWVKQDDKRLEEEADIKTAMNILRKAGYEVLTRAP